jgi:hypothetical protein
MTLVVDYKPHMGCGVFFWGKRGATYITVEPKAQGEQKYREAVDFASLSVTNNTKSPKPALCGLLHQRLRENPPHRLEYTRRHPVVHIVHNYSAAGRCQFFDALCSTCRFLPSGWRNLQQSRFALYNGRRF